MGRITVRSGTNDVWSQCQMNQIDPNLNGSFNGWVSRDWGIIVYDTEAGSGSLDRRFLLVSPNLSSKYLQRLVTLLRGERMTCGFEVREARAYEKVFVIDPEGDFSDAALSPLVLDGADVVRVPGETPAELAQGLQALLA